MRFFPHFLRDFYDKQLGDTAVERGCGVRRVEEGGREREREREEWGGVERGEVVANERERKKKN